MTDRNVQFPARYRLTKVEGTDDIYDFEPVPGTITAEGTIINKAALLKDATAALYGLPDTAVPDDVFALLKTLVSNAQSSADIRAKIETGSYEGTSSGKTKSITFSFVPKLVFIFGGDDNLGSNFSAIIPCMNLGSTSKTYSYLYCSGDSGSSMSNVRSGYSASLNGTTLQLATSISSMNETAWGTLMNRSGYTYKYIAIA